jgi:hypothetical protein
LNGEHEVFYMKHCAGTILSWLRTKDDDGVYLLCSLGLV